MCGIIMAHDNDKPVNKDVINQFEDQHSRGMQGFGIIDIDKNGDYNVSRATEGAKFMFDLHKRASSCLIVHHRIPTSTPNYLSQTHPIEVDNGSLTHKYLVIHNGCVSNASTLKKKHEELGFVYKTLETFEDKHYAKGYEKFNDSESLAVEVAQFIEKQTEKIDVLGSAAFIAVQIDKKTDKAIKIFFGRNNGNPLNMSFSRGKLKLSSEGEGENIKELTLYSWDFKNKMKKRKMSFATPPPPVQYKPMGFDIKNKANGYCSTYNKANEDFDYPYHTPYDLDDPYDDNLESIKEFRMEEVNKEIEEYFDLLTDDLTMHDAVINETLNSIAKILAVAKEEVEKFYMEKDANLLPYGEAKRLDDSLRESEIEKNRAYSLN